MDIEQSKHLTDEALDLMEERLVNYREFNSAWHGFMSFEIIRLIDAARDRNKLALQLEQVDWQRIQAQAARIAELEQQVAQLLARNAALASPCEDCAKLREQLAYSQMETAKWRTDADHYQVKAALAGELAKALRALHHYETLGTSDLSGRSRAIVRAARAIDRWDAAQKGNS